MDFAINERQQQLIESAKEVYARKLKPFIDNNDVHSADGTRKLRREMAHYGLLGVNMPVELGGSGLPLLDTLLLTQTLQACDSAASRTVPRPARSAPSPSSATRSRRSWSSAPPPARSASPSASPSRKRDRPPPR
jgi:alkylation response protein AidB-like acyl-CoA dehydrogenase